MELDPTMPVPLKMDEHGSIRVGGSRVTLDVMMSFYLQGNTPESICDMLPTLTLAHVYGALAYYQYNKDGIDEYLRRGKIEEDAIIAEIERRWPPDEMYARLMARRKAAG